MWVDVADVAGQCTSTRQCVVVGGQTVELVSASADNCGYAPATWRFRNCESAPVTFGDLRVAERSGSGAWQYDFVDELAHVQSGDVRAERFMQLRDGRYDVSATVMRGTVRETLHASFEIPAPRTVIAGRERCAP